MVQSGDVLAALILPKDFISDLESLASLNPSQPTVKVLVNEEDPVKASLVNDRIDTLITQANLKLSKKVTRTLRDLSHPPATGRAPQPARPDARHPRAGEHAEDPRVDPAGAAEEQPVRGATLARVINFARLARQNLNLATPLLSSIAHPINVDKEVVSGSPPSLDAFAISVAATVTLMFVTVLLVAGSLALEREENAFARLTRGLVEQVGSARREGRAWGGRSRSLVTLADARRAVAVRPHRLGPVRPDPPGDRGGRRRLRRVRRRDRRRPRARSGRARCSRSWSRCRSRSSRWSRPAP